MSYDFENVKIFYHRYFCPYFERIKVDTHTEHIDFQPVSRARGTGVFCGGECFLGECDPEKFFSRNFATNSLEKM